MPFIRESSEKDLKNENVNIKNNNLVTDNRNEKSGLSEFEITRPKYRMEDLILSDNIKEKLSDVIAFSKYKGIVYEKWGLQNVLKNKSALSVNLYGESGTGKTMTAHAIASELERDLICVNYSQIESKYVGETAKNLNGLFKYASDKKAIIFFDEADAMLSKRVTNMSNSTDVSVNQTRSVLLNLMNDYNDMIIFTTNFISNFDHAFMRRINFHIKYDSPNVELRQKLWSNYIPKEMPTNLNIKEISLKYDGISGSDISNAVLNAAIKAARLSKNIVEHKYFEQAIESILLSKRDNGHDIKNVDIVKREVSEEHALSQLKNS